MSRNTLNALGTGVVSLAVFFFVGILIGSHFATNHIQRVLPPLSSKTVAVAQSLGSGAQDPDLLPAQPAVNGAPPSTSNRAAVANTERQVGRSAHASLTLFAPAPAPAPGSTTEAGGHRLFLAGGPALPIQDIAHFVDPCTIVASVPGCPHGVAGTVMLADTHPAPLLISHIESLEGAPTDDYQTCMVDDTAPVPSGDGRFAIASNNPANFTATDAGTGTMLATTSTSSELRAQFDGEESADETLMPVTSCIDLPITITRGVLITGTDDLGTTSLAGIEVGPEQQGGRPPVNVTSQDAEPLGLTVLVPVRSGQHETAIVGIIQDNPAATQPPTCAPNPPPSPSPDGDITNAGTEPTDYAVSGYSYDRSYDQWTDFQVNALHEWVNASYVLCIYWEEQPHSFSPAVVEDAEAIPVTFPETLAYAMSFWGLDPDLEGGTAEFIAPGAITIHLNHDPDCRFTSGGPLRTVSLPTPLCTVTVGDFDPGGTFQVEVDWGRVGTVAWASLPTIDCTTNSADVGGEVGSIILGVLTAGISTGVEGSTSGVPRSGETCIADQQWIGVPVSDGTGDTALAQIVGVPVMTNPNSGTLIVGTPATVAGAGTVGTGIASPPLPLDPQLDLFHTALLRSASDPSHSLVLNWTADRPVSARAFFDSYGAGTCTTAPSTLSGGGLTLLMTSGSITLPNLCADTRYAVGVEITDENGNSSTYSRLVGLTPPPAIGNQVDFQDTTEGNKVQFNAALHLLQPNMDSPDYALITALKVTVDGAPIMDWTSGSSGSGSGLTYTTALCVSAASPNGVSLGVNPANGQWSQAISVRITATYITLAGPCPGTTGTVGPSLVGGLVSEDQTFAISNPLVDDAGVTAPNPTLSPTATQDLLSVEIDQVLLQH